MTTSTDIRPCTRYRAFLACTARIPCPDRPSNPFEWAYVRENIALYEHWVHNAWSNYNRQHMPAPTYHGFTHPEFDAWLQSIYLPHEIA